MLDRLHTITLALYCLIAAVPAAAETPQPFTATYAATLNGIPIKAVRSLKTLDNGQQELRFSAKSWLAQVDEFSQFVWDKNGNLIPQNYQYHRSGLGRDREAILSFDWVKKRVTNNVQKKPWVMHLPDLALDKLSYQVQLRNDLLNNKPLLEYAVADGGRIKHYRFEALGEDIVDTAIGKFHTIKIKRIRKHNSQRITHLWLAKEWDYLIVRIQQWEKKGKSYEIKLAEAKLNGTPVKGF